MRPGVTWLVVGAVAALGIGAAVDALRGEGEAARPPETTTASTSEQAPAGSADRGDLEFPPPALSSRARVPALLAQAEARGALYVADMSCRLRALRLPELEWLAEPAAPLGPCRFTVDANGLLFPDGAVFARGAELGAVCSDGRVRIFDERRLAALETVAGCSPAWKPDGSLTVLRRGELVQATGLDQERVVLSHEDVIRALGRRARLLEVAWIDNESFGVALRRNGLFELAVFRGRHLVARPSFSSARIEGLRAGASGLLAAETGTSQFAVSFFDRRGRLLLSVGGRAFSWQPEGVVAAVAGRLKVLFVAPLTRDVVSLSLFASDLEWR
jgi:hypothetical protein